MGGISKHHSYASKNIEYLIKNAKLQVYGYGAKNLPYNSNIRKNQQ